MNLKLRQATYEDMELIFVWANDELTRKNSFHDRKITYSEHKEWFHKKMDSEECDILICVCDNVPIGMLRLEYNNQKALISFSVDKDYRGQGLGGKILELARSYVMDNKADIKYLYGLVKYSNVASQKNFEKLNYVREDLPEFIQYYTLV